MKFCVRCGKQCEGSATVCPACGQMFVGGGNMGRTTTSHSNGGFQMPTGNGISGGISNIIGRLDKKVWLVLAVVVVVLAVVGLSSKKNDVIGTWEINVYSNYYDRNVPVTVKIEKDMLTYMDSRSNTGYYPIKISKNEIEVDLTGNSANIGYLWRYEIDGDSIIIERFYENGDGTTGSVISNGVRVD